MWRWRPSPLVAAFRHHDVPFVVVGGVAVACYTDGERVPDDLDVVVARTRDAERSALDALAEIAETIPLRTPLLAFSTADVRSGYSLVVDTVLGRLDVIGTDLGVSRNRLVARQHAVLLDRVWTPVCAIDDLMAMKKHPTPRQRDLSDLALLANVGATPIPRGD